MNIEVTISGEDLKKLISERLKEKFGDHFDSNRVTIEVKSKQNYKSEWESAEFRATYKDYGKKLL